MREKLLAAAVAAALTFSLAGAAALAAEEPAEQPGTQAAQAETQSGTASEQESSEQTEFSVPETGTDTAESGGETPEEPEDVPEESYIPDAVGQISFENVERRMRENNLSVLALEENIQSIQVIDFDSMYEDYRKALNGIAKAQWGMIASSPVPGLGNMLASSMDAQYNALRDTFEQLKNGELQKDYADAVRQMQNAQDQLIMAGETLYIALSGMEVNERSLDRSLAAMDRSIEEMELRYQLGQISELTLKQTKAGRTTLVSSQQTLAMNLENYRTQLETMVGAEQTGRLKLSPLPQVTNEQLEAMDLEKDLAAAKEKSYSLYAASLTLKDAREAYSDSGAAYRENSDRYQDLAAEHTWQGAQHTYNAAVESFELSFRTLYNQVKDCKQVLTAAQTALAVEQDNYSVSQLKFEQGSISQNALLDAQDKVKAAQETVDSAAIDLFSSYNNYRWAVDHGILN